MPCQCCQADGPALTSAEEAGCLSPVSVLCRAISLHDSQPASKAADIGVRADWRGQVALWSLKTGWIRARNGPKDPENGKAIDKRGLSIAKAKLELSHIIAKQGLGLVPLWAQSAAVTRP
jgi:hypothetical protein